MINNFVTQEFSIADLELLDYHTTCLIYRGLT